jgi:outer membrane protein assembly factor BamB
MSKRLMLHATVALGTGVLAAGAADWPQWRGPNRDAKVTGFEAPKTWPKELTKKWKVEVGGGDASPSLVGDRLYVFSRKDNDEVLRCLDAGTGKEIWQDKYAAEPATGPAGGIHAGPRASPTVAESKVVTLGASGTLSCLDAATGKVTWRNEAMKEHPRFFVSSSPLVVDGMCIAQVGGSSNGAIVAYDLASGSEKWKASGESPGYASPVLMTVDGTKLIVAETERRVVALTAGDGKLVWETSFPTQGMGYNASTPIVDGQTIIYGGDGGRGEKDIKLEKKGDKFEAKELWSNKDHSVKFNTPVLKNGILYCLGENSVGENNQFFALNVQDGKTLWSASTRGGGQATAPDGGARGARGGRGMGGARPGFGEILDAGSVLFALTPNSQLIVFQPSDKEFKQLASYKVADAATYTYPIVAGNRIYIKDQDSVTLWTID